ncbi:MAG: hypothetical protein ABJZ56_20115 [Paracoccaceae bacterium]
MLTVEYLNDSNEVGITLDEAGAKLLAEIIDEYIQSGKNDHVHLSNGPTQIAGWPQPNEACALSTEGINTRDDARVVEGVTLVFRMSNGSGN